MEGPPTLSPTGPRLLPRNQNRTPSLSPSRSPIRQRITDDILSDLSPATTLEAFTSPSGKLRASIEAASPSERAFGIRATVASKKIQEWIQELSNWPWPAGGGSAGFEAPGAKRRKLSVDGASLNAAGNGDSQNNRKEAASEYMGSILAQEVFRYDTRIEEITEDMEDLEVEEIKSQVLDTHTISRSRPSSALSIGSPSSPLASYTRMDDFTAVVTATVLQALPNLSKLMRLMDVWSIRLSVLLKVPALLLELDDAEVALKSGWQAIEITDPDRSQANGQAIGENEALSRETFEIIRDVLKDKVTSLGQDLDYMLDTLEGRQDTLPESWLDRMEAIEQDYGEWVVAGDRKVREGEWARMGKLRKGRDVAEGTEDSVAGESSAESPREIDQKDGPTSNGVLAAAIGAAAGLATGIGLVSARAEEPASSKNQPITDVPLTPVSRVPAFDGNGYFEQDSPGDDPVTVIRDQPKTETYSGYEDEDFFDPQTPTSPKIPRFGHGFANAVRRSSSPQVIKEDRPGSSDSFKHSQQARKAKGIPGSMALDVPLMGTVPDESRPDPLEASHANSNQVGNKRQLVVDVPEGGIVQASNDQHLPEISRENEEEIENSHKHLATEDFPASKSHSRNVSGISGYSTSEPTPMILEAEPAEYFRPVLSPVRSPVAFLGHNDSATPTSQLTLSSPMKVADVSPTYDDSEQSSKWAIEATDPDADMPSSRTSPISDEDTRSIGLVDGASESVQRSWELEEVPTPVLARKTSIARINSPSIRRIEIPRRGSAASEASTLMRPASIGSPIRISSPSHSVTSDGGMRAFVEESPSVGRFGRQSMSCDDSPPNSPPTIPATSPRPTSFEPPKDHDFDPTDPDVPTTPLEPPYLENVGVSQGPLTSSPPKSTNSDDQMQQQIREVLESIPAHIRLASEPPDMNTSDNLPVKKTRRSITPSFRSHSSMSNYSRAPTPSFTLAPAYSKGTSRPRPHSNNPEIKLYHLSRSTGEAPIKLFVRLVGENGERVMVRVGGGWADLGEYLKEYASHHGRRSTKDEDKVEIQDLTARPRLVSNESTASSSSTVRGSGRESPFGGPISGMDRPLSSLYIRKTRKSVGEEARQSDIRSPSTPINVRTMQYETPPSEASSHSRSTSRLSWTDEDSSLGLAGPKSKKVVNLSEKDQEWVESMKEKVRQASAEKEKMQTQRGSFGEMDKIGGTKRWFRKG